MSYDYLEHHGILGQKWGVRRYQNENGSYTKAGMQRYNNSKSVYEKKKNDFKNNKDTYKTKYDKKLAKSKVRAAKKQMNKDYKHLEQDRLADKGKIRFNNGERIRDNNRLSKNLARVGGTVSVGANVLHNLGILDKKAALVSMSAGVGLIGAGAITKTMNKIGNKELSAYYAHTSNY